MEPSWINISEWRDSHFSLEAAFKFLDSGSSRTLVNIYGPSAFPQKKAFINHLRWLRNHAQEGTWIVGGYFNLIISLREKKGGRIALEKYQEEFREILTLDPLADMELGDGWYTWNNMRGGDTLVASQLDRFLVSENFFRGVGDIRTSVLPGAGSDH